MLIAKVSKKYSHNKPFNTFYSAVLIDTDTYEVLNEVQVQLSDRNIPLSKWENVKYKGKLYKILDTTESTVILDKIGEVSCEEVESSKKLDEGLYLFSYKEFYTQISTGYKVERLQSEEDDSTYIKYKNEIDLCNPFDLEFSHFYIHLESKLNPMLEQLILSGVKMREEIDSHIEEELFLSLKQGSKVTLKNKDANVVVDRVTYDGIFLVDKKYPINFKDVKQIISF